MKYNTGILMKYNPGCDGVTIAKEKMQPRTVTVLESVILETTQWSCPSFPSSLIPVLTWDFTALETLLHCRVPQGLWSTPSFSQHFHNCWVFYFTFCIFLLIQCIYWDFCSTLPFSTPSQNSMKYCSCNNINPRWELFESPVPHLLMASAITGSCYLSFIHFLFQGISNENQHNPSHKQYLNLTCLTLVFHKSHRIQKWFIWALKS